MNISDCPFCQFFTGTDQEIKKHIKFCPKRNSDRSGDINDDEKCGDKKKIFCGDEGESKEVEKGNIEHARVLIKNDCVEAIQNGKFEVAVQSFKSALKSDKYTSTDRILLIITRGLTCAHILDPSVVQFDDIGIGKDFKKALINIEDANYVGVFEAIKEFIDKKPVFTESEIFKYLEYRFDQTKAVKSLEFNFSNTIFPPFTVSNGKNPFETTTDAVSTDSFEAQHNNKSIFPAFTGTVEENPFESSGCSSAARSIFPAFTTAASAGENPFETPTTTDGNPFGQVQTSIFPAFTATVGENPFETTAKTAPIILFESSVNKNESGSIFPAFTAVANEGNPFEAVSTMIDTNPFELKASTEDGTATGCIFPAFTVSIGENPFELKSSPLKG